MTEKTFDKTKEKQEKKKKPHRFKKGESGNPNGRPKGTISITTEIKRKLKEIPKGQKKTYLELFINSILKKAIVENDQQMIKTIWNYIDGLPKQPLEHSGEIKMPQPLLKNVHRNNSPPKDNNSE